MAFSAYKPDKQARINMCSSSRAAAAISYICSSSSESMYAQANGQTPAGRGRREARREELLDCGIYADKRRDGGI
jgi:hypothetical protein